MTWIQRPALAVASAAFLALSLTACGDDGGGGGSSSGAPDDASKEDFCEVALSDPGDDVDAIHDWAENAEDVGTPEGIPDDAREGFEILVDIAKDIDEDEAANLDSQFDDEEDAQAFAAYATYIGETCGPDIDLPTEDLSLPTEDLSLPTEDLSVPTDGLTTE